MLRIPDNSTTEIEIFEYATQFITDLEEIANLKISDAIANNLLIFSNEKEDLSKYKQIFSINKTHNKTTNKIKIKTNNLMGFVGRNSCEVTIHSRFAQNKQDYFLHYMIQKVFSINILDLNHSSDKEQFFDFLIYMFVFYFKKALNQGVYKEYQKKEYNNSNIKGSVVLSKHIKHNIPFNSKIFYNVKEYSYDNKITQLIRHTIDYIKKHKSAYKIFLYDRETQSAVRNIEQATPTFVRNQRQGIIDQNIRSSNHSYFSEYKKLQKICLQILNYENLKYGEDKNKIYGLLFDGAWLWEEYLNSILKECKFKHSENVIAKNPIYMFKNQNSYKQYPDFWKENIILDAKYKKSDNLHSVEDLQQMITYMYVKRAKIGGFIAPLGITQETNVQEIIKVGELNGYGGDIYKIFLAIANESENFNKFSQEMQKNEQTLISKIKQLENVD